jgi:tRNA dimethylallyltransferase
MTRSPPGGRRSSSAAPASTCAPRSPTRLFGLDMDRGRLYERIDARVDAIVAGGGAEEARRADALGPGRTARKALGLNEILAGDLETMKRRSRNYARRQLTWMRKIPDLTTIDRTDRTDAEVAAVIRDGVGSAP